MTVLETTAHARVWADITTRATTPQLMACVLAAHQSAGTPDPAALTQAYRALRESGRYAELDRLPLCAGEIAELAIVVNGGAAGVRAGRLDGAALTVLARNNLTAALPGSRWPVGDRRATVIATLPGVAVVRAAQGHPVTLNDMEALPLAVIERAMRTSPDHGCALWPGGQQSLRMAQMWRLVEYVRLPPALPAEHWSGQLGKAVYRLTEEGAAALERHRRAHSGHSARMNTSTADFVARLAQYGRGDAGVLDAAGQAALQKCLEAGWVTEGAAVPGTNRRALKVTEDGRDALAGWRFRQSAAKEVPRYPTRQASELQRGQVVRMLNRRDYPGLGADWVTVQGVNVNAVSTASHLARNCEVWVTSAAHAEPFLYAGQPVFRAVRFQVKPL